ncbi:POK6 protein, partial [Upupa epops]|nr:POK6 protein [Upupa epops]
AAVISHLLAGIAILGHPTRLKMDNGPVYTSQAFTEFCMQWDIILTHCIPYNSIERALVEGAHRI